MTQRYAQAGTVGKRQDVSKGMFRQGVAPKIARRTAAAGRGGRRIITGTPGNDIIGKGVLSEVAGGMRAVKTNFGRGASGAAKPKTPLGSSMGVQRAGGAGLKTGQFAAAKPAQFGAAAAGTGVLAGYGASKFGKRRFDPEDERRHRQGLEAGALGTGGALATGYGVKGVLRDTKSLQRRGFDPGQPPKMDAGAWKGKDGKLRTASRQEDMGRVLAHQKELELYRQRLKASRGIKGRGALVRGKPAALLGGGIVSMAGAAALHGQRRESRWD